MEPRPSLFQVLHSPHSPNFSKAYRPTTATHKSSTTFSQHLERTKPRPSSNRKNRIQVPYDAEHFQFKDFPSYVNKTASPHQSSLASPTHFQSNNANDKDIKTQESPYIKSYETNDDHMKLPEKVLEHISKTQQHNVNVSSEKDNFILLRKDAPSPTLFGPEQIKSIRAFAGQKITGLFSSKMFPMTDVKGKLNLKFFLKPSPSIRTSTIMEFRPSQTAYSPHHDTHTSHPNLQRQSSVDSFYNPNQQFEMLNKRIIERPRRLIVQNYNTEHTPTRAREEKNWGIQKVVVQKKMPCVRLSVTPSRVLTRHDSRQFKTLENSGFEDRDIKNEEKRLAENNEALDDLLTICTKKKGDIYDRYRDKELQRKNTAPTIIRRKINFIKEDRSFSRADVSPTAHRSNGSPVFFNQTSVEIKKIKKYADVAHDLNLNGFTEWETLTANPTSERQELLDLKTASNELNPDENDTIKKKKVFKRKGKTGGKTGNQQVPQKKIDEYRNFIMGLNFSFGVVIKHDKEKSSGMYKYYIGKGNNNELIRALMKQRWWWAHSDSKNSSELNFMWTQLGNNRFINSLKSKKKVPSPEKGGHSRNRSKIKINVNSIISHESDTETDLDSKGQVVKLPAGDSQRKGKENHKKKDNDKKNGNNANNFQRVFTHTEIELIDTYIASHSKTKKGLGLEDWEELCRLRKKPAMQIINDPITSKMCNHLENNFHLANKKALLWNMRSYYEALNDDVFQHLPLTYHVKTGPEDEEFKKFLEYYRKREGEIQEEAKTVPEVKNRKIKNIWIVKPGEETNRGFGITVCSEFEKIQEIVSSIKKPEANEIGRTYLIQQYIDRPFLYNKRKFDLRCYTLLSCINSCMKGYWYQGGYIRTSSKEFSVKNLANKQVHLTNNAVQKKADDYGKFESGNKLTFADFQKYLETHHQGVNFDTHIYPKLRSLAIDTMKAVFERIDPYRRQNCFEIFGLDFMIDSDLKVWLIEVNTNPDITTESPILAKIIPGMVDNALKLTLDQMFPPPVSINKKHTFPENLLENNKFELVFDEIEEGPELTKILKTSKKPLDMIFDIEVEGDQDSIEELKE